MTQPKTIPAIAFARSLTTEYALQIIGGVPHWYRWTGACWEWVDEKDIIAQAHAFLSTQRAKVTERAARDLVRNLAVLTQHGIDGTPRLLPVGIDGVVLQLRNAVLDIRDGVIHAHQPDRAFGLTHTVPVSLDWTRVSDGVYTPEPLNPDGLFGSFIEKAFAPADQAKAAVALGSTLDPSMSRMVWLYGPSGSGKTTMLRLLSIVHANPMSLADMTLDRRVQPVELLTSTLIVGDGHRINPSLAKALIERVPLLVNVKHSPAACVALRARLVIAHNTLPDSDGLRRRAVLVPMQGDNIEDGPNFVGRVLDNLHQHQALPERLMADLRERQALLDWLLTGLVLFQARGKRWL